jgi:hypothetical protein
VRVGRVAIVQGRADSRGGGVVVVVVVVVYVVFGEGDVL